MGQERPQSRAGIADLVTTVKHRQMGSTGPPQLPGPCEVCWLCLKHTGHGEQKLWCNSIREGQLLVREHVPGGNIQTGGNLETRRCVWRDRGSCVSMGGRKAVCVCGGGKMVCTWQDRRSCVSVGGGKLLCP